MNKRTINLRRGLIIGNKIIGNSITMGLIIRNNYTYFKGLLSSCVKRTYDGLLNSFFLKGITTISIVRKICTTYLLGDLGLNRSILITRTMMYLTLFCRRFDMLLRSARSFQLGV